MELELKMARFEVDTLKKLMSGKDSLVLQKCHALNLAKVSHQGNPKIMNE